MCSSCIKFVLEYSQRGTVLGGSHLINLPLVPIYGQWIGSALVQIIACHLFGAKPLSKQVLDIVLIGPLGTNFSEIWIEIQNFSFTKMPLKMSSGKWWPFCPGGDELTIFNKIALLLPSRMKLYETNCLNICMQWVWKFQMYNKLPVIGIINMHHMHLHKWPRLP